MTECCDAGAEATHISIVAEGLRSAESALSTVQNPAQLSSLCLHGNLLTSCAHLSQLVALTDLNLSANQIASVKHLGALPQLVNLNLSSNRLVNLDGFPTLPKLIRFNVAHNRLTCLSGLCALDGGCLNTVDIRSNKLAELRSLAVFAGMPSLRTLNLSGGVSGNPLAGIPGLQPAVAAALPQVCI
jgi:Leucine-rich repeat (LRR) protein